MSSSMSAAEIRRQLGHPVVDADGHIAEHLPTFDEYLRAEGVRGGMAEFFPQASFDGSPQWAMLSPEERLARRAYRSPWWGFPMANTVDFATAHLPGLLDERLEELGIDFAVCYPSIGMTCLALVDTDLRQNACRAMNKYLAEQFRGYEKRLRPVAVIPTSTPDEALAELDHAVALGFKAVLIGGFAVRQIPAGGEHAVWIDNLGIDSLYDYNPLWQRLVDLGISAGVHSGSMGWSGRRSVSNFSYNHIGNFAGANEATAKSLFFAGVPNRFPGLRLAFLEGGTTFAVQLLHDLVGHLDKRGPAGLEAYNPARLDAELFDELLAKYGADRLNVAEGHGKELQALYDSKDVVDDFEAIGADDASQIVDQFTRCYSFGCEADDPLVSMAFDAEKSFGKRLRVLFSSDIGHWDVPDMAGVLPEAYEQIEHGLLDVDQFRAFVFEDAVRFYTDTNPDFFAGTAVEADVARVLAG